MSKLANIIVPAILFILLSPGFLVTLPPNSSSSIFLSDETSKIAVITHAVVFIIIYALLRHYYKSYYIE